jgi:phosphatidylglycerophosphate synthase
MLSAADRARLDQAVKTDDSPYTTFVISPWSKYVAWRAGRLGLTPNQVTLTSVAVAVAAGASFAAGTRLGYVLGALLLQLSFGLDCADGQLARLTSRFSALGGWLDAMCDRLKEYLVYAGLALGSVRSGDDVWLLALVALALQTARHAVDWSWAVTPASASALTEGVHRRAAGERRRWHWSRKVAILPIGERWMLISVLAALTRPRIVFTVLIGAGALSAAYMLAARIRRSMRPGDEAPAEDGREAAAQLGRLREAGPAAALVARVGPVRSAAAVARPVAGVAVLAVGLAWSVLSGSSTPLLPAVLAMVVLAALGGRRPPEPRWGWVVPPLLRSAEFATVITAGRVSGAGMGVVYTYLLVVVWLDYDSAYRVRHCLPGTPRGDEPWPVADLPGFELRMVVVAVLVIAGGGVYTTAIGILAAVLAVVAIRRGTTLWRRLDVEHGEPTRRGEDR